MPSLNASMNIDTAKLQPTAAGPTTPASNAVAPVEAATSNRSHFLDSSLPVLASGADVYTRQFYGRTGGLPQRRFFPAQVG